MPPLCVCLCAEAGVHSHMHLSSWVQDEQLSLERMHGCAQCANVRAGMALQRRVALHRCVKGLPESSHILIPRSRSLSILLAVLTPTVIG